ncbi:MAG: hypothetical protein V3U79_00895 [Dehalococcoidia bacterium]
MPITHAYADADSSGADSHAKPITHAYADSSGADSHADPDPDPNPITHACSHTDAKPYSPGGRGLNDVDILYTARTDIPWFPQQCIRQSHHNGHRLGAGWYGAGRHRRQGQLQCLGRLYARSQRPGDNGVAVPGDCWSHRGIYSLLLCTHDFSQRDQEFPIHCVLPPLGPIRK